jgi:hypothetical protein
MAKAIGLLRIIRKLTLGSGEMVKFLVMVNTTKKMFHFIRELSKILSRMVLVVNNLLTETNLKGSI